MNRVIFAVSFFAFVSAVRASDKQWHDALSAPSVPANDSLPAQSDLNTSLSTPTTPREAGIEIVRHHLQQIKMSKLMPNTITLEPYWLGVFAAAGRPDLYEVTQADIQRALEAGLAPYLRGEPISAPQFADAAIAELKKNMGGHVDAAPIPIEPIQDVIVH